jgi:hypothetical protein
VIEDAAPSSDPSCSKTATTSNLGATRTMAVEPHVGESAAPDEIGWSMGRFPAMARDMVGIREAVRGWHVSERALRRKLTAGEVDDSLRADDDSWLLPSEWLDTEFDRTVIDLRDPVVSNGLAAVLSELSGMNEQVKQAEVRAAVAESETEAIAARLRLTTDQLEQEETEFRQLQHDHSELQRELAVQLERLEQTELEAERAWSTWEQTEAEASQRLIDDRSVIEQLNQQLTNANHKVRLAESMTSRFRRRTYQRLARELDDSTN